MRARILRPMLAGLMVVAVMVPSVAAAPPTSGPPMSEIEWEAGLTCSFTVLAQDWSRARESTRGDTTRYIGPATTRLTNVDHPDQSSVTVKTGGQVRIQDLGDGSQRIGASGTTLFFFFPGDVTPTGGDAGGWFLISGEVSETLSADGFITELTLRGSYRDLCAEIAD